MAAVLIELPDDLADRIEQVPTADRAHVLAALWQLDRPAARGYEDALDLLNTLARLPTPEEVLKLRPSEALQTRISFLLHKNREEGLSEEEEREWQEYDYVEQIVQLAKATAYQKISPE